MQRANGGVIRPNCEVATWWVISPTRVVVFVSIPIIICRQLIHIFQISPSAAAKRTLQLKRGNTPPTKRCVVGEFQRWRWLIAAADGCKPTMHWSRSGTDAIWHLLYFWFWFVADYDVTIIGSLHGFIQAPWWSLSSWNITKEHPWADLPKQFCIITS